MEYFWTLTLQLPTSHGFTSATSSGVLTIQPGATMQDIFAFVQNRSVEERPEMAQGNVIHFFAAPNTLA